jgi:hypothetical protein
MMNLSDVPLSLPRAFATAPEATPVPRILWGEFMSVNTMGLSGFALGCHVYEPPLLDHVPHVIEVGTEKEVPRIATRSIVARMQNLSPVRDWPVSDFPSYTVSFATRAAELYSTISTGVSEAHPRPAFIGLTNSHFGPKAFRQRLRTVEIFARWHRGNIAPRGAMTYQTVAREEP